MQRQVLAGILRDVFTMGARPGSEYERACALVVPDHPKMNPAPCFRAWSRALAVTAIAWAFRLWAARRISTLPLQRQYSRQRDDRWRRRHEQDFLFRRSTGVGNPVVYVGSKTGRDGIHGATMASSANLTMRPKKNAPLFRSVIRLQKSCCSKPVWN